MTDIERMTPEQVELEMDRMYVEVAKQSAQVIELGKEEAILKIAAETAEDEAFIRLKDAAAGTDAKLPSVAEMEKRARLEAKDIRQEYETTKNARQDKRLLVSVEQTQLTLLMAKLRESRVTP